MSKTYIDKNSINPVGVSKVRSFGGPIDLKIEDKTEGVTDNAPMNLGVDDLLGAVIAIEDDSLTTKYIADAVYESSNKIYFTLGTTEFYYDKATSRFKFVE